jgi:predicted glycogen debranching enzyme
LIKCDHKVCGDFAEAASCEWLEANGLRGYASSSIIGCNTRRYHGLLVTEPHPGAGRAVLLSKLEEDLSNEDLLYPLSTNQRPNAVYPRGHRFQIGYRLSPFPTFCYLAGGATLHKEVFMPYGENAVVINYQLDEPTPAAKLLIKPLVAGRNLHHLIRQSDTEIKSEIRENEIIVRFAWGAELHIYHNGEFTEQPEWFYNFEYEREKERGLDYTEDLFSPGVITLPLAEKAWVVASSAPLKPEPDIWREKELARREALLAKAPPQPEIRTLITTADTFLVQRRQNFWDIIAGYHWFEEWGRDSMISLPGLCLEQGKPDIARAALLTYAQACCNGLIPNRFEEPSGEPVYNTVDAALWFINAMYLLAAQGEQESFVRQHLLPVAQEIVQRYASGTHYGIHADRDGFIVTGADGSQLTWMDAKVGDTVMTPRAGRPVEIQALWYNALRILEKFGERAWSEVADRLQKNFAAAFWNEAEGCLYDCLPVEGGPDASIRPNQVLALSLPHPLLDDNEKSKSQLAVVEKELLTPRGLRTLSPRDSRYRGRYEGDVWSRDSAYHQGTVWPWLLGPFVEAYLRVHGATPETKAKARGFLTPLLEHLNEAGLGSISEVFDGDPPHRPGGCISQAWSVAEFLRAWALTE